MADAVGQLMTLLKQVAGISLSDTKRSLVESRLQRRLLELNVSMDVYAQRVQADKDEMVQFVNLLTTNHTAWLREPQHFEDLEKRILPEVIRQQKNAAKPRLRIWCAAAATGEEPWSIALSVLRVIPDIERWDAAILATDISTKALAIAQEGIYHTDRISPLSQADRTLALEPHQGQWRVNQRMRNLETYARLNLIESWPMRGPFDLISCRNVMIYFERKTQEEISRRMSALLAPGGTFYIGHSESLNGLNVPVKLLRPAVYLASSLCAVTCNMVNSGAGTALINMAST